MGKAWVRGMQPQTPEWFALREKTIYTASRVAGMCGLHTHESPRMAYRQALGLDPPPVENQYMRRGRAVEPYVLAQFAAVTGFGVLSAVGVWQRSILLATPDGVAYDPTVRRQSVVEAKSCTNFDRWTDGPPIQYLVQVHVQMFATGLRRAYIPVASRAEFRTYAIDWSSVFWTEHVLPRLVVFVGAVNTRKEPEPRVSGGKTKPCKVAAATVPWLQLHPPVPADVAIARVYDQCA